jgi:hypothetical protein
LNENIREILMINNIGGNGNFSATHSAAQSLSAAQGNVNSYAQDIAQVSAAPQADITNAVVGLSQANIQGQAASKVLAVTDSMLGHLLDEYA